jgi:putative FmdB family regulatory protein
MPLYEYECQACHRRIEKIQKYSDAELTVCPHCGGALERTVTAPAFQFAGGGWYKDLYSSAKPAESAGGGDSGGDSAGKSDSGSGTSAGGDSSTGPATAAPAASAPATAPAAAPSAAPAASKT